MTKAKEKPATDGIGSGPRGGSTDEPSITVADARRMTQAHDRSRLQRAVRLATEMARDEDYLGTYKVHRPESSDRPPVEVYWVDGDSADLVAHELRMNRDTNQILRVRGCKVEHGPFYLATEHVCGDLVSDMGEGRA